MKHWIRLPRTEGISSRQAHCDLPAGTFEREMGREGFFGPSTQMYHKHPPTGWIDWEGPLRPRAFDLGKITIPVKSPWEAVTLLHIRARVLSLLAHRGRHGYPAAQRMGSASCA